MNTEIKSQPAKTKELEELYQLLKNMEKKLEVIQQEVSRIGEHYQPVIK